MLDSWAVRAPRQKAEAGLRPVGSWTEQITIGKEDRDPHENWRNQRYAVPKLTLDALSYGSPNNKQKILIDQSDQYAKNDLSGRNSV